MTTPSIAPVSLDDDRLRWLDTALDGKPDEVKARVLNLVIRYRIDPENEFFMIFVAMGEFLSLLEDAPQNWAYLFAAFEETLAQWKQQNIKTLDQLVLEAESVHQLTQHSIELNKHLSDLQAYLMKLSELLENLHNVPTLHSNFNDLKRDLQLSMAAMVQPTTINVPQPVEIQRSPKTLSWISKLIVSVILTISVFNTFQIVRIHTMTQRQSRELQWLLEKQNRRDCLEGIVSDDDPICSGF